MKKFLTKYKVSFLVALPIIFIMAFLWIWFYETMSIQIERNTIETGFKSRFVLISDLHLGLHKNRDYMAEIVGKINEQDDIEFVAIAGDLIWGNFPVQSQEFYDNLFEPLKDSKYPVLVVFGNHENGSSDPDITDMLTLSIEKYGMQVIEDKAIQMNGKNIVGLTDAWEDPENYKFLDGISVPIDIVLTHNPDTVLEYDKKIGLSLAGHTHCGQIRIPGLYKRMLPIRSDYEKGLYDTQYGKVFVTCGLGETGIPFRLWNRPTIDVIETD